MRDIKVKERIIWKYWLLFIAGILAIILGCSSSESEIKIEYSTQDCEDNAVLSDVEWNYWRNIAYRAGEIEGFVKALENGADCPDDEKILDWAIYVSMRFVTDKVNLESGGEQSNCDVYFLQYLLEHCEVDPNRRNTYIGTFAIPYLVAASEANCIDAVSLLIEHGADVNAFEPEALYPAPILATRDLDIIRYLVEHGADVNTIGTDDLTLADHIFPYDSDGTIDEKDMAIREYLYSTGADRNWIGRWLVSEVHGYVEGNSWNTMEEVKSCLRQVLEKGIDVNARGYQGKTALDYAMETEMPDVALINLLLEAGAKRSEELE